MSCGEPADEVHHIRPRHLGGTDHPRNLVPLCEACHDEIHRRLDAAVADAIHLVNAMTAYYGSTLEMTENGYSLK